MTGPKILFLDLETAPLESMHWSLWKQNIGLNQIKTEWSILSFVSNWLHDKENKCEYMDTFDKENVRDDFDLLRRLWELLDEADFVVAQNGVRFDMKKLRARMVMAGLPPFSPVKVIDTLLIAKATFGFTSNKLEWMSTYLSSVKKRKHGKFPGFELWIAFLQRIPAARREMRLYNIDDVRSLRQVYLKLRPWFEGHPNVAAFYPDDELRCNRCGSDKLKPKGYAYTNSGQYHRYRCGSCMGWSRSRYTINTNAKRKATVTG